MFPGLFGPNMLKKRNRMPEMVGFFGDHGRHEGKEKLEGICNGV